jgi:hypothetical protein
MFGIPREVIEHHLKIHPDARPIRQKPRKQSIKRQNFIREEVRKLLQVGFIEEVHHRCGWPIQSLSPRLMGSFGCASTTPISIRHVQKTLIHFHE